jgi:protein-export membrane protein SecD
VTKAGAIVKFCIICLITLVGVIACFIKTPPIPYTNSQGFVGFFGAIESKMGIDLKGGILAVYTAEPNEDISGSGTNLSTQIDATVARLSRTLTSRGFVEATVTRQGANKIRVEVPGMHDASELMAAIGEPAILSIRDQDGREFMSGKYISGVAYYQNPNPPFDHGVRLSFNDAGGVIFRREVQDAYDNNRTIAIVTVDEDGNVMSELVNARVTSRDAGRDNTTIITGDFTRASAERLKTQIESGLYSVRLSEPEISQIPPTLGEGAIRGALIACALGLLFIFIFFIIRYGDLGLLAGLSLIAFVVLFMFALAVVEMVQLTLPGIAGIILAIGFAVDATIIVYERIRDEYRSGKRMAIAVEDGFKKSVPTILDANITTIIAAGVLYFLGTGPIKGFAMTLMLGVGISMLVSLFITRSYAKLYLYINPNNARRLRFGKIQRASLSGALPTEITHKDGEVQQVPVQTAAPAKPKTRSLNFKKKEGAKND